MLAEAMRQGQVETETRMLAMKALLGSSGPNPLIDFFSDDRVVAELEVDAAEIRRTFFDGYFRSPFCFCPCFWPHQLLLGMPCMFLCSLGAVDDAAKAHRLILRERSIEYRVGKYPSIGAVASGRKDPKWCCEVCWAGEAGGFHEVYPLAEVSDARVQPCQAERCGAKTAPDTFVLKVSSYMGGMQAAAAIDAPKNGAEFAALVLQKQQRLKEAGGVQVPAEVQEAYNKYVSGGAGGMMGGMMGMGGMGGMGGAQMQAQMQAMQQMQQMQGVGAGAGMGGAQMQAQMQAMQQMQGAGAGCCTAAPPMATGQVILGQTMERDPAEKSVVEKLSELTALRDAGALDDDEFKAAKAQLLAK